MQSQSYINKWYIFCKERFELVSHALMLAVFTLANYLAAINLSDNVFSFYTYLLCFILTFLFFFRLRCFDEIKDYEVDVEHNPTRPLARGLLSIIEVKIMIAVLIIAEIILFYAFSNGACWTYLIALVYSLLMYKEFFIGNFIRPFLTTYAISHTFVSSLVACTIISMVTGLEVYHFSRELIIFALLNWAMFNFFEFARKTYAPSEERLGVDTYSSLFKPVGSGLLNLSQPFLALVCLSLLPDSVLALNQVQWLLYIAMSILVLMYMKKPEAYAKKFRLGATIYLVVFYTFLSIQLLL